MLNSIRVSAHDCAPWGQLAEIAAQFLHKGSRVYVHGRLHTSRWADDESGASRSSVEIILDDLSLLDRPMPAVAIEQEREMGESQPKASTPMPAPHSATQQTILRPPQPVHLPDWSAQPRNAAAPAADTSDPLQVPCPERPGTTRGLMRLEAPDDAPAQPSDNDQHRWKARPASTTTQ